MAMKSKLPPNGGYVADESSIKQMNGKPIGSNRSTVIPVTV